MRGERTACLATMSLCVAATFGCAHGSADHADAAGPPHGQHTDAGHGHPRFDDPAAWSARWEGPERDAAQKPVEVLAYCDVGPGMTVVDLGTGTGYFVPHLSRAVGDSGRVIALDIEASMVDWVQARIAREGLANASARVVGPDEPGLDLDTVDRILVVNTWHHIESRDEYLDKLRASLRIGGRLCLVEQKLDAPHGPPRAHRLTAEVLKTELTQGGLDVDDAPLDLPEQVVVAGTLRARKTLYAVGDWVEYHYSGAWLESEVRLREEVVSARGARLELQVTATRPGEARSWIQVVIDTKANRDANKVEELFELVDGERVPLGVDEIGGLYAWVLPETVKPPIGPGPPAEQAILALPDGQKIRASCTSPQFDGDVTARFCDSDEFLWTHVEATFTDPAKGVVWQMKVTGAGGSE